MLVVERVVFLRHAERLVLLLGDAAKVLADLVDQDVVDVTLRSRAPKVPRHRLGGGLGVAVASGAIEVWMRSAPALTPSR